MKKIFILLLSVILLGGCSKTVLLEESSNEEVARDFCVDFGERKYETLTNEYVYTEDMKKVVTDKFYEDVMNQITQSEFVKTGKVTTSTVEGYTMITTVLVFTDIKYNVSVVFDKVNNGTIAGFKVSPFVGDAMQMSYKIEEIPLNSYVNGMDLNGILTVPKEGTNLPCVILVHGSGPSDMDETIYQNKPFRDIAWMLAERGIATYRYDKSTYAYPNKFQTNSNMTLMDETVNDAVEIAKLIKDIEKIDRENVYILGHSLGGNSIPLIANEASGIAGYIIMAGNTRPMHELIIEQTMYISNLDGEITVEEQQMIDYINNEIDKIKDVQNSKKDDIILGTYSSYWKFLNEYNPVDEAKDITEDVLVLQGLRDYQVTIDDYNGWYNEFNAKNNWSFKTYDNLNHLMMAGDEKSTPEEYTIPSSVDISVIDDLEKWIKKSDTYS